MRHHCRRTRNKPGGCYSLGCYNLGLQPGRLQSGGVWLDDWLHGRLARWPANQPSGQLGGWQHGEAGSRRANDKQEDVPKLLYHNVLPPLVCLEQPGWRLYGARPMQDKMEQAKG